jgi:hypothetical protein
MMKISGNLKQQGLKFFAFNVISCFVQSVSFRGLS